MRNHIELENYLTEEIYILKMKESALNLIININFEITRISEEIEKSKDEFANKKGFKNELAIRGQREYISELETSLLLVQYLSRIHNGNKENIKYALFVRRNKYVARREAFIYARRNHYDLNKIKSKMDDKMKSLEILFPKIEYPNQELMGPIIFGKEYAFSLREILMLIKFYKTAMSKIN